MDRFQVVFSPLNKVVEVDGGKTLLEAATEARIDIQNLCGGEGICNRCRMVIRGEEDREVLGCNTPVTENMDILIPEKTIFRMREMIHSEDEGSRIRSWRAALPTRLFGKFI